MLRRRQILQVIEKQDRTGRNRLAVELEFCIRQPMQTIELNQAICAHVRLGAELVHEFKDAVFDRRSPVLQLVAARRSWQLRSVDRRPRRREPH